MADDMITIQIPRELDNRYRDAVRGAQALNEVPRLVWLRDLAPRLRERAAVLEELLELTLGSSTLYSVVAIEARALRVRSDDISARLFQAERDAAALQAGGR